MRVCDMRALGTTGRMSDVSAIRTAILQDSHINKVQYGSPSDNYAYE